MDHEAVVFGASGLVGAQIVERLLADPRWSRVRVIGAVAHERHRKLAHHPVDMSDTTSWAGLTHGDVVFSALDGARADRRVEIEIARVARRNGIPTFVLLSAAGADPAATFYHSRTRGELEGDITALAFPRARFLRPRVVEGRGGKALAMGLFRPLERMLPISIRPLSPSVIAAAAIASAYNEFAGVRTLEAVDIYSLGTRGQPDHRPSQRQSREPQGAPTPAT